MQVAPIQSSSSKINKSGAERKEQTQCEEEGEDRGEHISNNSGDRESAHFLDPPDDMPNYRG